jgi:hypothetical protein
MTARIARIDPRRKRAGRLNPRAKKKKEAEASPASDALRAVPFPASNYIQSLAGFPQAVKMHSD